MLEQLTATISSYPIAFVGVTAVCLAFAALRTDYDDYE